MLFCLMLILGTSAQTQEHGGRTRPAKPIESTNLPAVQEAAGSKAGALMHEIEFNGEVYRDDRMYVLYTCKCTEEVEADYVSTTIYHEASPSDAKWCIVTYKNTPRYRAFRVDVFDSRQKADDYVRGVEPEVPLISLGGRSRNPPLAYPDFVRWKEEQGFEEYDYTKLYEPGGENPQETIVRAR